MSNQGEEICDNLKVHIQHTNSNVSTFTNYGNGGVIKFKNVTFDNNNPLFGQGSLKMGQNSFGAIDWRDAQFAQNEDFTVDFWFYKDQNVAGKHEAVLGNNAAATASSANWRILYNHMDNQGMKFIHNSSSQLLNSGPVPLGQWNHLAIERFNNDLYMYLNGVIVSTENNISKAINGFGVSGASAWSSLGYSSEPSFRVDFPSSITDLGFFPGGPTSYTGFDGYIQDFRIIKGVSAYSGTSFESSLASPVYGVEFDGSGDYIEPYIIGCGYTRYASTADSVNGVMPSYLHGNSKTVTLQFRATENTSTSGYLISLGNNDHYATARIYNGKFLLHFGDSGAWGTNLGTGIVPVPGKWYDITFRYGSRYDQVAISIDGVEFEWADRVDSPSSILNTMSTIDATSYLSLNATFSGSAGINGDYRNVKIFEGQATDISAIDPSSTSVPAGCSLLLFNSANGSMNDDTEGLNNLPVVGNPGCPYGSNSFLPGDFTISFWANKHDHNTGTGGWSQRMFSIGNISSTTYASSGDWLAVMGSSSQIVIDTYNKGSGDVSVVKGALLSSRQVQYTQNLPLNEWYHIAFVRSGVNNKLYYNGECILEYNESSKASISGPLYIGSVIHTNGNTYGEFDGLIRDFKVTETADYQYDFTPTRELSSVPNLSTVHSATTTVVVKELEINVKAGSGTLTWDLTFNNTNPISVPNPANTYQVDILLAQGTGYSTALSSSANGVSDGGLTDSTYAYARGDSNGRATLKIDYTSDADRTIVLNQKWTANLISGIFLGGPEMLIQGSKEDGTYTGDSSPGGYTVNLGYRPSKVTVRTVGGQYNGYMTIRDGDPIVGAKRYYSPNFTYTITQNDVTNRTGHIEITDTGFIAYGTGNDSVFNVSGTSYEYEVELIEDKSDNYSLDIVGDTKVVVDSMVINDSSESLLGLCNLAEQTITFALQGSANVGDSIALSGSSSSGLTVSYASSDTSVATISGTTLSIIGGGSVTITASQSGNDTYSSADSVTQSLSASKQSQSIVFTLPSGLEKGDVVTLNGVSTSGLAITYASSNPGVISISGGFATIVSAGSAVVTASQSGNNEYEPAEDVSQIIGISNASFDGLSNASLIYASMLENMEPIWEDVYGNLAITGALAGFNTIINHCIENNLTQDITDALSLDLGDITLGYLGDNLTINYRPDDTGIIQTGGYNYTGMNFKVVSDAPNDNLFNQSIYFNIDGSRQNPVRMFMIDSGDYSVYQIQEVDPL